MLWSHEPKVNLQLAVDSTDDSAGPSLRLCLAAASTYRMVAYQGTPDSTTLPAVFGLSDFLGPAR